MELQYIKDAAGNPLYVLLPVAEFERLTADDEQYWQSVPVKSNEFDNATLPHEVVGIILEQNVSNIAAWRIYRGMSQSEAAEKAGISQSALSQIERKGKRPQSKTREQFAAIYGCHPDQLAD